MTVSPTEEETACQTMWGLQKAYELLARARFTSVSNQQFDGDTVNNRYTCRR